MACPGDRYVLEDVASGATYVFNSSFHLEDRTTTLRVPANPIPRGHGSVSPKRTYLESRRLLLRGALYEEGNPSAATFFAQLRTFAAGVIRTGQCLLHLPNAHALFVEVRQPRVLAYAGEGDTRYVELELSAADPLVYEDPERQWTPGTTGIVGLSTAAFIPTEESQRWSFGFLWRSPTPGKPAQTTLAISDGVHLLRLRNLPLNAGPSHARNVVINGAPAELNDWSFYAGGTFPRLPGSIGINQQFTWRFFTGPNYDIPIDARSAPIENPTGTYRLATTFLDALYLQPAVGAAGSITIGQPIA